jgi:hypothetical protein
MGQRFTGQRFTGQRFTGQPWQTASLFARAQAVFPSEIDPGAPRTILVRNKVFPNFFIDYHKSNRNATT